MWSPPRASPMTVLPAVQVPRSSNRLLLAKVKRLQRQVDWMAALLMLAFIQFVIVAFVIALVWGGVRTALGWVDRRDSERRRARQTARRQVQA